jgi:DNA-binding NtrC family response regulator
VTLEGSAVLQERRFERLGATRSLPAGARIIAATNHDLEALVRSGEFREDLFYRLNVVAIRIPALGERREDIPALVNRFLAAFAASGADGPRISREALPLDRPGSRSASNEHPRELRGPVNPPLVRLSP